MAVESLPPTSSDASNDSTPVACMAHTEDLMSERLFERRFGYAESRNTDKCRISRNTDPDVVSNAHRMNCVQQSTLGELFSY